METLRYYLGATGVEAPGPTKTVDDVLKDVEEMEKEGLVLRDMIRDFPETGGGLMDALAIHNYTAKLQSMVDKTTADVKAVPTPVSIEDSTKALDAVKRVMPLIEETMKLIVQKKTAFENVSIGGIPSIVKMDLDMFHTSAKALEEAVVASTPPELFEIANAIVIKFEAIFAEAIAAYS